MSRVSFTFESWPIVRTQIASELSDTELADFMREFVALPQRKENYAMLIDMTRATLPKRNQGDETRKYIDPERDNLRRYLRGVAIIIESTPLRTAMNAMMLFIRPPYPTRIVKSREEGETWCNEQLKLSAAA